jgi:hypothetical protein
MDPVDAASVFDSPVLPVYVELAHRGVSVTLRPDGAVKIHPRSALTPVECAILQAYRHDLRLLLRICDPGVAERQEAFRRQLEATPPPAVPAFLCKPDVPYVAGVCFSCGDETGRLAFGRCWRCSLAWRLACRLPIPVDLAMAVDAARIAA